MSFIKAAVSGETQLAWITSELFFDIPLGGIGILGRPGTIGAGGNGSGVGTAGEAAGVDGAPEPGNNGTCGETGCSDDTRGGSTIPLGAGGNNPGVGRTAGGIAELGAG